MEELIGSQERFFEKTYSIEEAYQSLGDGNLSIAKNINHIRKSKVFYDENTGSGIILDSRTIKFLELLGKNIGVIKSCEISGVSRKKAQNIFKRLKEKTGIVLKCKCGAPINHGGYCKYKWGEWDKTCKHCKKDFKSGSEVAKYCSVKCKTNAKNKRKRLSQTEGDKDE